ncbi:MAG: hypothetical protein OEU46_09015 [Alphaproteobacteria bacterium]|nr:hypothetical protein [Alphaproteobacteria bacterium]
MIRSVAANTAILIATLLLSACVASESNLVVAPQPLHLSRPATYQLQGHLGLDLRALHDGVVVRQKSSFSGAEYQLAEASRRMMGDAAKHVFTQTTEILPESKEKYPRGYFDLVIQPKAKEIAVTKTDGNTVNVFMVFVLTYRSGRGKYLGFETLLGEGSTQGSIIAQPADTKRAIAAALEDMGRRFVEEVPNSKFLGG